jgi:hypothetical protein
MAEVPTIMDNLHTSLCIFPEKRSTRKDFIIIPSPPVSDIVSESCIPIDARYSFANGFTLSTAVTAD